MTDGLARLVETSFSETDPSQIGVSRPPNVLHNRRVIVRFHDRVPILLLSTSNIYVLPHSLRTWPLLDLFLFINFALVTKGQWKWAAAMSYASLLMWIFWRILLCAFWQWSQSCVSQTPTERWKWPQWSQSSVHKCVCKRCCLGLAVDVANKTFVKQFLFDRVSSYHFENWVQSYFRPSSN